MSQQNASRKILILENNGKIIRGKYGIKLSNSGIEELRKTYFDLKTAFEWKNTLELSGFVVDGIGEGKYYIKKYSKKIREKVGFEPYPGTLNIKLDEESIAKRQNLQNIEPIIIDNFEDGGRKFGGLFLYKCQIGKELCVIVIPMRTHHGSDILEIISDKKMRDKLKNTKVIVNIG